MYKNPLFYLNDGSEVYDGDVLWHPDRNKAGWCCFAFKPPVNDLVMVISDNGAVPTVKLSDLKRKPPVPKRCKKCGQLLPESKSTY